MSKRPAEALVRGTVSGLDRCRRLYGEASNQRLLNSYSERPVRGIAQEAFERSSAHKASDDMRLRLWGAWTEADRDGQSDR
jgi:hypothetical protein